MNIAIENNTRVMAAELGLTEAASLLQSGRPVAFPTETVYGLGADATNPEAVARVFAAKGRPSDNPLIVHICHSDEWKPLVKDIDERAAALAKAFWPGPLTIVLPRSSLVPDIVTAGLNTVGVRMPAHPLALALIKRTGKPLAAPSANRSGRPSPTDAASVLADMDGRIPLILDGGPCAVGLESTVVSLASDPPILLRPGAITPDDLRVFLPNLRVHPAALTPLASDQIGAAPSPGMKHTHYAPAARLTLTSGTPDEQLASLIRLYDRADQDGLYPVLLVSNETALVIGPRRHITLGPRSDARAMSRRLFAALRDIDRQGAQAAFGETFEPEGVGLAMMNRLLRAAGYRME